MQPRRYTLTDAGLTVQIPGLAPQALSWEDLEKVYLHTTDAGPFLDDVFFVLEGAGQRLIVPQDSALEIQLLDRLQQLPGFNHQQVVEAMHSNDQKLFLAWQREASS